MKIKCDYLFCFLTSVVVFLFFIHTVNYSWKHFDENIIFQESILPIPSSLSQIFEYISLFGVNNHFEASNPFYSNISHIRGTPIDVIFNFFIFLLFQKSALAYHLFSLTLHVLNSALLFLLINKVSLFYSPKETSRTSISLRLSFVSILTLFWALHPVNVESVLFATNYGALITYFFCFLIIFLFLNSSKVSLFNSVLAFFLYLFPLFLNEYSVTLSLLVFCYLFATSVFQHKLSIKDALLASLKRVLPLLLALIIFVIYFLSLPTIRTTQEGDFLITLERVSWFSPQIFLHYIKLIFFPINLSIDQTAFVKFPYSLFHPYAVFSSLFIYSLLLFSFISLFFLNRKKAFFFFIVFVPFFLALLPFLHIISPLYCIASERYLYFPLSLLIFGFAFLFFYLLSKLLDSHRDAASRVSTYILTLTIMVILLISFSTRTYFRSLDWKNSVTLFSSALSNSPNDLFKALRLEFIGSILNEYYKDIRGQEYINQAISTIEQSLLTLEEKKTKYQDRIPLIIKTYGLDPKTIQAKTAFMYALTKAGLLKDIKGAYETLSPYMQDLTTTDTQILDLYLGFLFAVGNLDEAERILNSAMQSKISPTLLIIFSQLQRQKYNNLAACEQYLRESFKYFPYDTQTLLYLKSFYFDVKNVREFAFFSYLHGIRTHSEQSLQDAIEAFTHLNDKVMVNKSIKNIELLRKINK